MTRREKIIVGLMAAAVVGATADFALNSRSPAPALRQTDLATPDTETAIAHARVELASFELNPVQKQILADLPVEWRADLLQPTHSGDASSRLETAGPIEVRPVFTGYFEINGKPFAIINGQDYAEGDWLERHDLQIARILPAHAELKPQNEGDIVVIPIETDFTR